MPRKTRPEVERRVIEDFSHAIKIDKDTMARLVEFVLKGKINRNEQ